MPRRTFKNVSKFTDIRGKVRCLCAAYGFAACPVCSRLRSGRRA